jgi:hypothetical protein
MPPPPIRPRPPYQLIEQAFTVPVPLNRHTLKAKHLALQIERDGLPVISIHGLPCANNALKTPRALGLPGDRLQIKFFVSDTQRLAKFLGVPHDPNPNIMLNLPEGTAIVGNHPLWEQPLQSQALKVGTAAELRHTLSKAIIATQHANSELGRYAGLGLLMTKHPLSRNGQPIGNSNGVQRLLCDLMGLPLPREHVRFRAPGSNHIPLKPSTVRDIRRHVQEVTYFHRDTPLPTHAQLLAPKPVVRVETVAGYPITHF